MAWWPSVIAPGQTVGDIIHETDLFTTFARLAGATKHIPTDRIIDGVDQTALLLKGDTFSRRDYVFIYTGDVLAATRCQRVYALDCGALARTLGGSVPLWRDHSRLPACPYLRLRFGGTHTAIIIIIGQPSPAPVTGRASAARRATRQAGFLFASR
jgi:hypothetical protein